MVLHLNNTHVYTKPLEARITPNITTLLHMWMISVRIPIDIYK